MNAARTVIGLALVAVLGTAGCAAGQIAETSEEQATLDGTNVNIGDIALRGLSVDAPDASTYPSGSNPRIVAVLVNTGLKDDELTGISSSVSDGWGTFAKGASRPSRAAVTLQPNSAVSFGVPAAEGRTLALLDTTRTLYPGSTISITFSFAKAGSKTFQVPIKLTGDGAGYRPSAVYVPSGSPSAG